MRLDHAEMAAGRQPARADELLLHRSARGTSTARARAVSSSQTVLNPAIDSTTSASSYRFVRSGSKSTHSTSGRTDASACRAAAVSRASWAEDNHAVERTQR